jgi:hypothetical protein
VEIDEERARERRDGAGIFAGRAMDKEPFDFNTGRGRSSLDM